MVDLQTVQRLVSKTVFEETTALENISFDKLVLLPEPVLALMAGRELMRHKNEITNDCDIRWVGDFQGIDLQPPSVCFEITNVYNHKEYLVLCFVKKETEENLTREIEKLQGYCADNTQVVLCTIVSTSENKRKAWVKDQSRLEYLSTIGEPVCTSGAPHLWIQMWQVHSKKTNPHTANIARALKDAVENMYFENLMNVVRRVIFLRYHIEEEKLLPELPLYKIIKMAFAKEQGVSMEEVYDPEALLGMTDSQLAANNLITDLQKAFSVNISGEETESINTLNDLVEVLACKMSR